MTAIQDLIGTLMSVKLSAGQLSGMITSTSESLNEQNFRIMALSQGSCSGEQAVQEVGLAVRSLIDATSALRSLEGDCSKFVQEIGK